jgi:hypothetical protein
MEEKPFTGVGRVVLELLVDIGIALKVLQQIGGSFFCCTCVFVPTGDRS